jgi:hypothetical protein
VYDPAEGVKVIPRHEVKKSADSKADQRSHPKAA